MNGILTGTCLQHPVVWYNNAENLGMRFFTIPVEDLFYGFELVLGKVVLFELIKIKMTKQANKKATATDGSVINILSL